MWKELGFDYEYVFWRSILAPKGTPQPIVDKMIQEVNKALTADVIKAAWAKNGSDIPSMSGGQMGTFVKSELGRWAKVVKDANIKID